MRCDRSGYRVALHRPVCADLLPTAAHRTAGAAAGAAGGLPTRVRARYRHAGQRSAHVRAAHVQRPANVNRRHASGRQRAGQRVPLRRLHRRQLLAGCGAIDQHRVALGRPVSGHHGVPGGLGAAQVASWPALGRQGALGVPGRTLGRQRLRQGHDGDGGGVRTGQRRLKPVSGCVVAQAVAVSQDGLGHARRVDGLALAEVVGGHGVTSQAQTQPSGSLQRIGSPGAISSPHATHRPGRDAGK